MAVTTYGHSPYQALKFADDSTLTPMWPDLIERRTNELPSLRVDNGSTYVVNIVEFRRHLTFYGPDLRGFEMPTARSVDIDTHDDLDLALYMAQLGHRAG